MDYSENNHTVSSQSSALIETASIDLYRNNAFRLVGLPVKASHREIERKKRELHLRIKLQRTDTSTRKDTERIASAVDRLKEPEKRLVDELFWFWGDQHEAANIHALDLDSLQDAYSTVSRALGGTNGMSCEVKHDMAVFFHLYALELEHRDFSSDLSQEQAALCAESWKYSYMLWNQLLEDEQIWSKITDRIREIDDPRLKTGASHRIRNTLPRALLSINAQLALQALQKNKSWHDRHMNIIHNSDFDSYVIADTLKDTVAPVRHRIQLACAGLSSVGDDRIVQGNLIIWELLLELRPLLRIIDTMLPADNPVRDSIRNQVAERISAYLIDYGNRTEDWEECSKLMSEVYDLAVSPALRHKIKTNLDVAKSNAHHDREYRIKNQAVAERNNSISYLTQLIRHKCNAARQASSENPERADQKAWELILEIRPHVHNLERQVEKLSELDGIKEEIVDTILSCQGIFFDCTRNTDECKMLLMAAYDYAATSSVRDRIDQSLKQIRKQTGADSLLPEEGIAASEDSKVKQDYNGKEVYDVKINKKEVVYPPMCVCCLGEEEVKFNVHPYSSHDYRVFQFPLCKECRKHHKELVFKRRSLYIAMAVVPGLLMLAVGLNNDRFEYSEFMTLGCVVAGVVLGVSLILFRFKKIGTGHASKGPAVILRSSGNGSQLTFRFWNSFYAKIFARLNSSEAKTKKSRPRLKDRSLLLGRGFFVRVLALLGIVIGILSVIYASLSESYWTSAGPSRPVNNTYQPPARPSGSANNPYTGSKNTSRTDPATVSPESVYTPYPKRQVTQPVQNSIISTKSRLEKEIEVMKTKLKNIESELTTMNNELETLSNNISQLKQAIDRYELSAAAGGSVNEILYNQAIDQHNAYVDQYNKLLGERQQKYSEYKMELAIVNNKINTYNQMLN